jgi:hypothetical protein
MWNEIDESECYIERVYDIYGDKHIMKRGLWRQMSPEANKQCMDRYKEHMAKPVGQRMSEYAEAIEKGIVMWKEVIEKLYPELKQTK